MITALDLFCGPGGMSEGLRMAGIATVCAIDYDKDACATFALNHREARVLCADVLSIDPADLPDTDLIVGGPPCVNFSTSKGSRANVLDGLRLVQWFLRVVAIKKPRFWIMENVPRVANHLPDQIPLEWIGIDQHGFLDVSTRAHFNSADYGVAQTRNRYLIGCFPLPLQTHNGAKDGLSLFDQPNALPWRSLGDVLDAFPRPHSEHSNAVIIDPIYGFPLPASKLTDHFMDTVLTEEEVMSIRNVKTEHPYMGRMSFPDELDRPARTIVATQLGRETLVLEAGEGRYRRATIRECASIQGFPITYQFTGNSIGSRYRQAGDAVPPPLSFAIAKRITKRTNPALRPKVDLLSSPLKSSFKRKRVIENPRRKFTGMVPGKEVRGSRVELDNLDFSRSHSTDSDISREPSLKIWNARLHLGEGKGKARSIKIPFDEALQNVSASFNTFDDRFAEQWREFFKDLLDHLPREVDPERVQNVWARYEASHDSPENLVTVLRNLVNKHFPAMKFANQKMRFQLSGLDGEGTMLRVRLVAGAVATSAFVDHLYMSEHVQKRLADLCDSGKRIPMQRRALSGSRLRIDAQ